MSKSDAILVLAIEHSAMTGEMIPSHHSPSKREKVNGLHFPTFSLAFMRVSVFMMGIINLVSSLQCHH